VSLLVAAGEVLRPAHWPWWQTIRCSLSSVTSTAVAFAKFAPRKLSAGEGIATAQP
jgi:hypothetical protein